MKIDLGFGSTTQTVEIPEALFLGSFTANPLPQVPYDTAAAISKALEAPIGAKPLRDIVLPGEKVFLLTSDATRPFPAAVVLPPLLDYLNRAGIPDSDISIVFAIGIHRHQSETEHRALVGDAIYERVFCVDSDPEETLLLGTTAQGTPVAITRRVATADRRIALGNIEYHYFAGYSGGVKALMPGVSTRSAIARNHSLMLLPGAEAGRLDDNPVRKDLEEALSFCPLDFILNVVLDEQKTIAAVFAGDAIAAHRQGCLFLDRLYRVTIPRKAPIVIASQGGSPKDLNLYQTQKALDNAKYAVSDGGIIILVGSCREGLGEAVFESWMLQAERPDDLLQRIEQDFQLGGHKAAAIAQVLQKAEIYLVSELAPDSVQRLFMKPFATVQQALDHALKEKGDAEVLVLPHAGSILPSVAGVSTP